MSFSKELKQKIAIEALKLKDEVVLNKLLAKLVTADPLFPECIEESTEYDDSETYAIVDPKTNIPVGIMHDGGMITANLEDSKVYNIHPLKEDWHYQRQNKKAKGNTK